MENDEGWVWVSSRPKKPDGLVTCMVNGCQFRTEVDDELTDHYTFHHNHRELVEAAMNLTAACQVLDPLQSETTNIYVRGFLEWVYDQNRIARIEGEGPAVVIPTEPTDEAIDSLIEGFIETDYRFGN